MEFCEDVPVSLMHVGWLGRWEEHMAWSGWPTTAVSQLTFSEWDLTLRPGREILVGYALSYLGVWHVFGDDKWVWFNGVIRGNSGAIEIVRQWAEAENLGVSHRHWRWVHWRNPSSETVYASVSYTHLTLPTILRV